MSAAEPATIAAVLDELGLAVAFRFVIGSAASKSAALAPVVDATQGEVYYVVQSPG